MNPLNFKKYFLRTLVIALSISGLIGIFIFLVGDFGETEAQLLLTTLSIGGFSLTGLCSTTIQNRNNLKSFSIIGMTVSLIGFLFTIGAIWEFVDFEDIWRVVMIFIILSVAIAHASLLLQIRPKTDNIKYLLIATLVFISFVTIMLIKSTLTEFDESEFYFRLLGVFSILDVLGTIVTPILNRISDIQNKNLILTLIGLTILSCSKDGDNKSPVNCALETLISTEQYATAPNHQLSINSLTIDDNCLKINFSPSGCSGDTWELKLIDSEVVLKSSPPQRNLRLSVKNEELCEAYITKELTFNILNLRLDGHKVQLNLTNSDKNILYEY